MEAAMRIYNGKPMINSVNGKQESMNAVFPLVKKYGGVVVGLTLDEEGIPKTAEGRVAIAEKIIKEANEKANAILREAKEVADETMKQFRKFGKENISVSESTVFCTTIEDGGLDINSENYPYLQCDAELLNGYNPEPKAITPISNFSNLGII